MSNKINITNIKHPEYDDYINAWKFYLQSYLGGKDYTDDNLFKYLKEGDTEFSDRKTRAYRENHTKKVINIINNYLFKENPSRDIKNTNILNILNNIDGNRHNINYFMKLVNTYISVLGRVYVMIDRPNAEITNNAENLKKSNWPYAYIIFPQNVLDIAFNNDGSVNWMFVKEVYRDDSSPFSAENKMTIRYRLWQQNGWTLYNEDGLEIDNKINTLGYVPCVTIDNEDANSILTGASDVEDIAYQDRNIFNNWSRLDTIVNDQTFSQLIMPVEAFSADILQNKELMEQYLQLGTKRILIYSAQSGTAPEYIAPDATQAGFILELVVSQTKQLYSLCGLGGDTATESKVESGVSKSYSFDKLNKKLSFKAMNLQNAEEQILGIFMNYLGITDDIKITYPTEFDTRTLIEEIETAKQLAELNLSQTFNKELFAGIVSKMFANSSDDVKQTIIKEISTTFDNKGLDDPNNNPTK